MANEQNILNVRILHAYKPAASWDKTTVLKQGEVGFESDTGKWKVGDGATTWEKLAYMVDKYALPLSGGTLSGTVFFGTTNYYIDAQANANLKSLNVDEYVKVGNGSKFYANNSGEGYFSHNLGIGVEPDDDYSLKVADNSYFYGDILLADKKQIRRNGNEVTWIGGRDGAMIRQMSYSGYSPVFSVKTTDGDWSFGPYSNNILYLTYCTDLKYNEGKNEPTTQFIFYPSGNFVSSYIGINGSNTGYRFYVNGSSFLNGDIIHNGTIYLANGKTYYINNNAQAYFNRIGIGTPPVSEYLLIVDGISHLKGDTRISGNLYMTNSNSQICWDSDSYRQRILTTDDATSDTEVFTFQQSSDKGSSWSTLFTIKDNGKIVVPNDIIANKSIRNLEIGGGIYWNPYIESGIDASDVASITVIKNGCAGGTELRISQQNDLNDVINLVTNSYIYLNGKRAFQINDSWLRINQDIGFSSGIYTGSSLVRSDYQFQIGDGGNKFYANNSGNGYFSNTLGIGGTNTGYRLYVNGNSWINGYLNNILFRGVTINNSTAFLSSGTSEIFGTTDNINYKFTVLRMQGTSPNALRNDYASGIAWKGSDTYGMISVAYGGPNIKIAGGNGTNPVWWIGINGTSGTTYNLNKVPDSDKLDGLHSSSFLRKYNTNDEMVNTDALYSGSYIFTHGDGENSGWPTGTKPSGSHDGVAILHVHTHTGNYYTQLALDTNQNYLWIRSANNTTTFGSWAKILTDANYTSTTDSRYVLKSGDTMTGSLTNNARMYCNEWIQFNQDTGLYWPNGEYHFYPCTKTSYGSFGLRGGRGGYHGLTIGYDNNFMTVMDSGVHKGLYQTSQDMWMFYYNRDTQRIGIRTSSLTNYAVTCEGDFYCRNGWLRTDGARGWYNESYGGGWYMSDSSWLRSYNNKNVYTGGEMQAGTVRANGVLRSQGHALIYSNSNSADYTNSAIEIREYNTAGAQTGAWSEAPSLTFHWGGRVQRQIRLHNNGWLYCTNDNFSSAHRLVLENGGTWGINISGNAAAAHRLIDQGTITAINGTSRYTSGLRIGRIYNSGYPFSYGVTLTMEASNFGAELIFNGLGGGGATGSGDMRFRTHSDWGTSEWGGWRTVLDNVNYAGMLDDRYVNVTGDTMTGNLTVPSVYTSNWFRSTGATGWYSETFGGGWYMADSTYIRAFNNKAIHTGNNTYYAFDSAGGYYSSWNNSYELTSTNILTSSYGTFNKPNFGVNHNTVQPILTWSNHVNNYGYQTRYSISSIRPTNDAWGRMRLAVGNNDGGTSIGAYLDIDGDGWIQAISKFGVNGINVSYNFYVNGTSYLNGDTTINGNLYFTNSSKQIRWTCGDNDYGRIFCSHTGSNAGYMEIATADDATEPIYVRQYSGVFSALNTTLTLLDGSHNTIIPNALTVGTGTSQGANYKFYVNGNSYFSSTTYVYKDLNIKGNESTDDSTHLAFKASDNSTRAFICFNGNIDNSYNSSTHLKIATYWGDIRLSPATGSVNFCKSSIRNLAINGGIYWDPYVESSTDGTDAASITVIKSGCAGGTELRINQQNDYNDVINLVTNAYIYLNGKRAFQINDSWLRINQDLGFSSGIYTGQSMVRTDNQFQIGDNGSKFYVNSSGNGYFSSTLGIGGTNTSYRLYVNGDAYFSGTNHVYGTTWVRGTLNIGNTGYGDYPLAVTVKSLFQEDMTCAKVTIRSGLYLTSWTSSTYGGKINFGDGDYVHLYEIADDKLEIKSNYTWLTSNVAIGLGNGSTTTYNEHKLYVNGSGYFSSIGIFGTNTSYRLFVNGSSYFNSSIYTGSTIYFGGGTTYYVNASATSYLFHLSIGGVNTSYKLYVNGSSYFNGALTFYGSDSFGIFTTRTNYGSIGSSSYKWYRSYINNMYGTVSSSGSDYAEFFEWADNNIHNEDRVGLFVTFDEEYPKKIRIANEKDTYILGIVSGKPSIIGNSDEDSYKYQYETDDFGRYIYEDKEHKKIKERETYDKTKKYIPRSERQEWDTIGMLGVLPIKDNGLCEVGGYCKCGDNGIAIPSDFGYRIVERISKNVIKVVFK